MAKPLLTLKDVKALPGADRHDTVRERKQRNVEKRYDLDLLASCQRSWMNKEMFRQERGRVLRYLFGNQWGDLINYRGIEWMTEEQYLKQVKNQVPLKNNIMVSLWMSVVGVHAKQETEPVCYARSMESRSLSDMLSAGLQTNWQNTYMPDVLDVMFAEYLISGAAFSKEVFEEREQLKDSYTDYVNPYYMFWEAGSDPAHRDVHMIGCLHDITPEELYFRFARPCYKLTIDKLNELYHINADNVIGSEQSYQQQNDINAEENISFNTPSEAGLCRVIEVWREEVKPRYQCHDPLATDQADAWFRCEKEDLHFVLERNHERKALYEQQGVPVEERAYITAEEIVDKYWHFSFLTPDGFILADGESPYDYKSHPFSMTLFPYANAEIHPFMSFFIDQQRYINRLVMTNDMAIRSAAKGMKFLPLSLKPNWMTPEEYANQATEFDAVFVYDDRNPRRSDAKPEFFTHSAMNIGTTEMLQLQLNMIHDVSGVSGAMQGKAPTAGTSAQRYQMETQNATTTIYPLIKRFTSFKERLAMKKLINQQQFYEDGRDITKPGDEEQRFWDRDNARRVQAYVSIRESMATAAYQQLGNEFLDKLVALGAIDARTYIKHYDAPFADKLLVELEQQQKDMQQGVMPQQPVQVPGVDQQKVQQAQQAFMGDGQLFMRQQAGQPLKPYNLN